MGRDLKGDRGRRRVGLGGGVVAAVIVLICVVVAVPVLAFVSRSVHTVLVPPYSRTVDDKSARALCPGGEHVQFGGFASSNVAVRGMRRSADSQWTVDGLTLATRKILSPLMGKVTSIAYCAYGPVPLKVTRSTRVGDFGATTATCPAGTVVVAGGFATSPHSVVVIHDLERIAADRWRVRVQRFLLGPARTVLTAVAYCGKGPAPKLVSTRVALSPRSSLRTTDAVCPAGKSLMFGGVTMSGGGVETLKAPTSTRWRVTGVLTSGGHGYLTALAYCR